MIFHIPYAPNDIITPIIHGTIDSFIFALSSAFCIAKLIPITAKDMNATAHAIVNNIVDIGSNISFKLPSLGVTTKVLPFRSNF